jgi:hypothetical protein
MGKQGPPHMQGQPPMQQGECHLTEILGNELGNYCYLSSPMAVSEVAADIEMEM